MGKDPPSQKVSWLGVRLPTRSLQVSVICGPPASEFSGRTENAEFLGSTQKLTNQNFSRGRTQESVADS